MADTHTDVQNLLADVRAWVPVVVSVGGTEYQLTGIDIQHDEDGAQTKAVLQTSSVNGEPGPEPQVSEDAGVTLP